MNPEQPLFWHQGLFLQPQHFQHIDRYHQSLLYPAQAYQQPYFWGIKSIEINETALLNRVVELTKAEVIFQDGTWVVLGKNGVLSARSFTELEDAFVENESFTLYLGLKSWDRFNINVSSGNETARGLRYQKDVDPVEREDLYENGPTATMYLMSHRLELFWEDEIKDKINDYFILPIGKLRMKGEDIRLASDFIPPVFMVQGAPQLLLILKQIRDHVHSRCRLLETYKPAGSQAVKDMELISLHYLSVLKVLNSYLALLHHFIETPVVHPWTLFAVLRQLIAELSTFSDRMNALGHLRDGTALLPSYNHYDPAICFDEAMRIISELLDGIVMGYENIIPLTRDKNIFSCEIPAESLQQPSSIYCLMVRTGEGGDQISDTVLRHVKVAHCALMPTLISRALSGIPLDYREIPPIGMAQRVDSWCFQLDTHHPGWSELKTNGNLCLYWESAPDDTVIELVIIRI
uniref:type VI secretion system baseplate subunit TssK n=1 Tax=Candidatus Electrothrix sp. TaxID=2170559 RepID=UPI004055C614